MRSSGLLGSQQPREVAAALQKGPTGSDRGDQIPLGDQENLRILKMHDFLKYIEIYDLPFSFLFPFSCFRKAFERPVKVFKTEFYFSCFLWSLGGPREPSVSREEVCEEALRNHLEILGRFFGFI